MRPSKEILNHSDTVRMSRWKKSENVKQLIVPFQYLIYKSATETRTPHYKE